MHFCLSPFLVFAEIDSGDIDTPVDFDSIAKFRKEMIDGGIFDITKQMVLANIYND